MKKPVSQDGPNVGQSLLLDRLRIRLSDADFAKMVQINVTEILLEKSHISQRNSA